MSEITFEAMGELLEQVLDQKLDQKLDEKLEPIKATLANHTAILDSLLLKDKTKADSKEVTNHRLDRLENWGQKVGDELNIKLKL